MKGNAKLIATLNALLADELTAISQYMVHSEMCDDWGYEKLHKHFEKRAIDEMKHAEKLIGRILFLEGTPIVSALNKIAIGADIPKQLVNDQAAEKGAIASYNEAILLAGEVKDIDNIEQQIDKSASDIVDISVYAPYAPPYEPGKWKIILGVLVWLFSVVLLFRRAINSRPKPAKIEIAKDVVG